MILKKLNIISDVNYLNNIFDIVSLIDMSKYDYMENMKNMDAIIHWTHIINLNDVNSTGEMNYLKERVL